MRHDEARAARGRPAAPRGNVRRGESKAIGAPSTSGGVAWATGIDWAALPFARNSEPSVVAQAPASDVTATTSKTVAASIVVTSGSLGTSIDAIASR